MEHVQLSPDRMAHVEALAALNDNYPEDHEILDLTDAERIEFAKLTGFPGMTEMVDLFSWRLLPSHSPCYAPLAGTERLLAEQALIALMRAIVTAWPTRPEIKRGRRKG